MVNFGDRQDISDLDANNYHRVDLKPGTKPMTIFISGPYGLRKGKRSDYGQNLYVTKNNSIIKLN